MESEHGMWKPFIIAISFVNLCYLRVWSELLSYTPAQSYEMRLPPGPHDYLAVILNVALWGVVLGIAAAAIAKAKARRCGPAPGPRALVPSFGPALVPAAEWLWLGAMFIPLNALRELLASRLPVGQQYLKGGLYAALGSAGVVVLGIAVTAGGAFALHRFRQKILGAIHAGLLIAAPFVPMTVAQAAWAAYQYDPLPFTGQAAAARREAEITARRESENTAPREAEITARRAVWVIFDEWDQRLTFDDRPADLLLPEIDRFRREALAALAAYPPRNNTLESIPSLLSGEVVVRAEPMGAADLRLTFRGSSSAASWRDVPNVFDIARARGFNTALVGVYHPYCRVLASSLTSCWWAEMPRPINSNGATLGAAMQGQTRSLFETWRLSAFGQSLSTQRKAREFPAAVERAKVAASDPSYGLVLLHLLTPHFPHAYDRRTGAFTLGNAPVGGYYDSLALTDRVWGELRRAMEDAGVWDTTAVLLSSDHGMKHSGLLDGKSDSRVPFLLKLSRQTEGFEYDQKFNTVVSGNLLLEILDARIETPRQAAEWLDRQDGFRQRAGE